MKHKRQIQTELFLDKIKDEIHILSLYCYLDELMKKCINMRKYDIEKIKGAFFIDLINNKNLDKQITILEKNAHEKNCDIKIDKDNSYKIISITFTVFNNNGINYYKYFVKYIHESKMQTQIINTSLLEKNVIYLSKNKENIGTILLIYHVLGLNTGLFWGFVPDICIYFENKYKNNIIECFASPFNHSLQKFYSILYNLDKDYGSQGDFFSRFLEDDYLINMINPPWTSELLIKTNEYIIKKLKKSKCVIYLYVPEWKDIYDPFYEQLVTLSETNNYKIRRNILKSRESYTYDYMNSIKIVTTFNTLLFMIHNVEAYDESDYDKLLESFLIK